MSNYPGYATPRPAGYYAAADQERYDSPSATPSPRGYYGYGPQSPFPQRPATRAAHSRHASGADFFDYGRGNPAVSPRYTSDGHYATANVSSSRSSRKPSWSSPRPMRERRRSFSYYRASDSHGESDEDEYVEINGVTYVLPARSRTRRYRAWHGADHAGGYTTNHRYHAQGGFSFDRDAGYTPSPRHEQADVPLRRSHSRRASTSMPQRPQTARPSSSYKTRPGSSSQHRRQPSTAAQQPSATAAPRKATAADAAKHRIPQGYSLKNWDPDEEPILLVGSVFDANSLGKWIFDWTAYCYQAGTPMSDLAGDLWFLLVKLFGKVKRSEEILGKIRSEENREMVEDFIESGERLTDKLRKLLKACEAPMIKASKKKEGQLGHNAGTEFVKTLFGRELELEKTERFMQSVRLWCLRFDANCEEILENPTV